MAERTPRRLLLVGAFPYPFAQGSQVYFQEQAIALREAGAEVELLTYASGVAGPGSSPSAERAQAGFIHHRPPAWSAPRKLASGPSLGKPLADWALTRTLHDAVASRTSGTVFDAVLTHNAEAALAASIALRKVATPQIYCVHTLLEHELSAYLGPSGADPAILGLGRLRAIGARWGRRRIDDAGRVIDRFLARRVEGWIALTHSSSRVMRRHSSRPGALIPPPVPALPGARWTPEVERIVASHGLELDSYFLYSGNLDGYQELPVLGEAARRLGEGTQPDGGRRRQPILVVASHDSSGAERLEGWPQLAFRHVTSSEEMLSLMRGARATVVMRRAEGGYPIKLANAHAAGVPSIVFLDREWGLTDGVDCLRVNTGNARSAGAAADSIQALGRGLAGAIRTLWQDPDQADRLGAGARSLYREQHEPGHVAERTLQLIQAVLDSGRPSPSAG